MPRVKESKEGKALDAATRALLWEIDRHSSVHTLRSNLYQDSGIVLEPCGSVPYVDSLAAPDSKAKWAREQDAMFEVAEQGMCPRCFMERSLTGACGCIA